MKGFFLSASRNCLPGTLMVFFVLPIAAGAQEDTGKYMIEAMQRLSKVASQQKGYKYASNISIFGGWVKEKKSISFDVPLVAGKKYCFVAAGDDDSMDVDLEVLDRSGQVLIKDDKTDREAVVFFTPETTETFVVRVILFQSKDNLPCVCAAVVLEK